jgi:hypothetical protein
MTQSVEKEHTLLKHKFETSCDVLASLFLYEPLFAMEGTFHDTAVIVYPIVCTG